VHSSTRCLAAYTGWVGPIAIAVSLSAVALAAFAASAEPDGPPARADDQNEVVAVVNDIEIERVSYADYLAVFKNPDGVIEITPREVLTSLINQAITHQEAVRRGKTVDPVAVDEFVDRAGTALNAIANSELRRTGDDDALRRRVVAYLELVAVRDVVLAEMPPDAMGTPSPSDLTGSLHRQAVWSRWLSDQRSCATIVVYDSSLGVTSSTPAPGCST